jgi:poly [ADP-ribose] polymerase
VDGQVSKIMCSNEDNLFRQYSSKVSQKKSKGYNEIEITYEDVAETTKKLEKLEESKVKKPIKEKKESKLHDSVQNLLRFIFDMKMIESSVVKVGFNVKKLPLGKLSKATVLKGLTVLKSIENALKNGSGNTELGKLSSDFYSIIPHDFKFQKMSNFIINTTDKLKDKIDLVTTLGDIQIAFEIANEVKDEDDDTNELDAKYNKMKCSIEHLDENCKEYDDLIKTITTTHGETHHFKVKPLEIFKIKRQGEEENFNEKIGNRQLLWHGSRFSNWGGILSQGLRIAPPEAPATGYMFGKGVYFADVVTKSANY